ncbi:MAG: hypothetical protein KatS3mg104_2819 [Phycisphaerae bacterium]|jgi:hypothetical protein|nr:MAG: hypothetical protein KatS3mg104_2819 [Phycisphaerae bacterium]
MKNARMLFFPIFSGFGRLARTGGLMVGLVLSTQATGETDPRPDIIVTGKALSVNGISEVSPGMFGVHATRLDKQQFEEWGIQAERKIDQTPLSRPVVEESDRLLLKCLYDRYQPALQLTDPNWEQTLMKLADRFRSGNTTQTPWIEFWNEPYLNWSVKPGVNYDGDFYDTDRAIEGGPVFYRGSNDPIPDLVWRRGLMAVRQDNGAKDYLAWGYMPPGLKHDDTYVFRGKIPMRVESRWLVRDTSQKSYWAGKHNVRLYNQMLQVFAPALKRANPDAVLVVGWDFHFYQGNWDAWHTCLKPTIDVSYPWIDGVTEHHYGGDTRNVAVSYEVATGYTLSTYGKFIRCFNTEAGGNLDPQRPDTVTYGQQPDAKTRSVSAMTYHLRDVIYLLSRTPDKAAFRAAHEPEQNGGDEYAFKLLKDLRGRLMETTSRSSDVWSVASLNDRYLSVVLFNDLAHEVSPTVVVNAPDQAGLAHALVRKVRVGSQPPYLGLDEVPLGVTGASWTGKVVLEPKSAVVIRFTLDGNPQPKTQTRVQYFAPDFIRTVEVGHPVSFDLKLPEESTFNQAVLRIASLAPIPADISAKFNDQSIAIPSVSGVIDIPLTKDRVGYFNRLTIHPGATSFQIASVSLFLINEP